MPNKNSQNSSENTSKIEKDVVVELGIDMLEESPNNPYKVKDDEKMMETANSVIEHGVLVPLIVRKRDNGKFQIVSGHRRKRACELAEISKLPCIVKELTDDEATIIMVDSNIQREEILPSEKAFAYKLKLEAIKHQGKRTDLTSTPVVEKLKRNYSVDVVASANSESSEQVRRYIRLTELIPELLKMVDNSVLGESPSIAFRPAVELSYLTKDEQTDLLDLIECYDCTPSLAQAIKLKNMSQNKYLTIECMEEIMEESKPNQTPKLKVSMNRLNNILPDTLKNDREREEYVIKAVEWYDKYQKKMRERKEQER